jgi:hypothetical protein
MKRLWVVTQRLRADMNGGCCGTPLQLLGESRGRSYNSMEDGVLQVGNPS